MMVSFYLTPALRGFADGRERIEIGGSPATLGDALEALWALCPGLRHRVATEQGEIREHVNVFVGQENVRYTGSNRLRFHHHVVRALPGTLAR